MCHQEVHSCACTDVERKKIIHRRAIACPSDVDCPHHGTNPNDWPSRHILECADFHIDPTPAVPYRCPEERIGATPGSPGIADDQLDDKFLQYLDMDYVTFHDHLAKRATAESHRFSEASYSTGDMEADEHLDYRYSTGWMFNRLADGTLRRIPDGNARGREGGYDPTPIERWPTAREWSYLIDTSSSDGETDRNGESEARMTNSMNHHEDSE